MALLRLLIAAGGGPAAVAGAGRVQRRVVLTGPPADHGVRLSIGGTVCDPADPMGKMFFDILATFAEFEVDLLRMRTREGMAIARANGRLKGKAPKLSARPRAHVLGLVRAGDHTIAELAEQSLVSRATIYRDRPSAPRPDLTTEHRRKRLCPHCVWRHRGTARQRCARTPGSVRWTQASASGRGWRGVCRCPGGRQRSSANHTAQLLFGGGGFRSW